MKAFFSVLLILILGASNHLEAQPIRAQKIVASLKANSKAQNVNFEHLKKFLFSLGSKQKFFKAGLYEGPQFAVGLFNEAQAQGIACDYIAIRLGVDSEIVDHASVRFVTSDRGEYVVDNTPILVGEGEISYTPRFVWLEVGEALMSVDLKKGPEWFLSKKFLFEEHQMKNLMSYESAEQKKSFGERALQRLKPLLARQTELRSLLSDQLISSKDPKDRAKKAAYTTELQEIDAELLEMQKTVRRHTSGPKEKDFIDRKVAPPAATLGGMKVMVFQKLELKKQTN